MWCLGEMGRENFEKEIGLVDLDVVERQGRMKVIGCGCVTGF